jgi:hypothetical protein
MAQGRSKRAELTFVRSTLEVSTGNGGTNVYGRADFTDNTYRPFGPATIDCQKEHTVNLWPPDDEKK